MEFLTIEREEEKKRKRGEKATRHDVYLISRSALSNFTVCQENFIGRKLIRKFSLSLSRSSANEQVRVIEFAFALFVSRLKEFHSIST